MGAKQERSRKLFVSLLNGDPRVHLLLGRLEPSEQAQKALRLRRRRQVSDPANPAAPLRDQINDQVKGDSFIGTSAAVFNHADELISQSAWGKFIKNRQGVHDRFEKFLAIADEWRAKPIEEIRLQFPWLGRCQNELCLRFFLARSARQTTYCTRKCAGNTTARNREREKHQALRAEDLKRVKTALRNWTGRGDWKSFVAAKAGVKKNFVTTSVNAGKLQ